MSYSDDGSHILLQLSLGGDANLDGKVDLLDLQTLASHWNGSANWSGGDFNYDGVVDLADLQIAACNWQVGVATPDSTPLADVLTSLGLPIVEVPEPSVVTILCLPASCADAATRACYALPPIPANRLFSIKHANAMKCRPATVAGKRS